MKKVKKELEIIIINKYLCGCSMKEISEEVKISSTTVSNILKRNNINIRTKGGIEKIDELVVIERYKNGESCTSISKDFNVTFNTIKNILSKNNIMRNNRYYNLTLDVKYWEDIDRYDKAYFLGLMITDGNVIHNQVRLSLQKKDEKIIRIFSNKIKNSNKLHEDKRGNGMIGVSFKNKKIVTDLSIYGVIPNKIYYTFLPKLNEDMMSHLIRGIIDGDGWISYKSHSIGICGNLLLIEQLKKYLVDKLDVFDVKIIHSSLHLWMINWSSKKDIKKICDFIYKDKQDCFLERKYENFLKIFHDNTEVISEIAKGSETL